MRFFVSLFLVSSVFAIVPMAPVSASQSHMSECEEASCEQMSVHDCVSMCMREVKKAAVVFVSSTPDSSVDQPANVETVVMTRFISHFARPSLLSRLDVNLSLLQQRRD